MLSDKTILFFILISFFYACNNGDSTKQENNQSQSHAQMNGEHADQKNLADAGEDDIISDTNLTLEEPDAEVVQAQPDKIAQTRQQLIDRARGEEIPAEPMRYKLEMLPYSHFADDEGYLDMAGVSLDEVQKVFGDPPIQVRQSVDGAPVRKEVRVYMPYKEDATGLYIFFLNEKVESFKMDEFNGIQNSTVMDYFIN